MAFVGLQLRAAASAPCATTTAEFVSVVRTPWYQVPTTTKPKPESAIEGFFELGSALYSTVGWKLLHRFLLQCPSRLTRISLGYPEERKRSASEGRTYLSLVAVLSLPSLPLFFFPFTFLRSFLLPFGSSSSSLSHRNSLFLAYSLLFFSSLLAEMALSTFILGFYMR